MLQKINTSAPNILKCTQKDEAGLNDFQKLFDPSGISIPKVGIDRFRIPLKFTHPNNEIMTHDIESSMYCSLDAGKTGINMSRFCTILNEEGAKRVVNNDFFKKVLFRFGEELKENPLEKPIEHMGLKLKLSYPIRQKSLKSDNWGWQYYPCEWEAVASFREESIFMNLILNYEYSSTCPCSLSMAKQYEENYKQGRTEEGNGIATAHAQRSLAVCKITYDNNTDYQIEQLIALLRKSLPTETQSLAKRIDEQAFAILNGDNPMFVEHAARRLSMALDSDDRILDWNASVEHFESLHGHNATAWICKNR